MPTDSKGTNWNLSVWLDRLGLKRAEQPDILQGVMPVQVVGDASALTSPLLPALAWTGATIGNVAGELPGVAIRSRAPGGTFVRTLRLSSTNSLAKWKYTVDRPEHVFTGTLEFDMALMQMGGPNQIANPIIRGGRTLVAGPILGTVPQVLNSSLMSIFSDEFYLAPGAELYIELDTVAVMDCAVLIQDSPAAIPTN